MAEEQFQIPYTLKLAHPIQYGERNVEELVFNRRLKAKDFKGIVSTNIKFDDMMSLIARITGESRSLIEEMDSEDFMGASEVVNSFLESGRTTGESG